WLTLKEARQYEEVAAREQSLFHFTVKVRDVLHCASHLFGPACEHFLGVCLRSGKHPVEFEALSLQPTGGVNQCANAFALDPLTEKHHGKLIGRLCVFVKKRWIHAVLEKDYVLRSSAISMLNKISVIAIDQEQLRRASQAGVTSSEPGKRM